MTVLGTGTYKNHIDAFLNEDVYVYAKPKGIEAHYPVDIITDTLERVVSREVNNKVSIEGKQYYDHYTVLHHTNEVHLKMGQSITLTLPPQKTTNPPNKPKASYKSCPSLRDRAHDLEFWVGFVRIGGFEINGNFVSFGSDDQHSTDLETAIEEVSRLKKVIQALDALHISGDINLTNLNDHDWLNLDILTQAFVDKEKTRTLRKDLPPSFHMEVGDLYIALTRSSFDSDGTSEVFDFFSERLAFGFETNGVRHFVPPSAMLNQEEWSKISNIPFSEILTSYHRMFDNHNDPEIFAAANNSLISALLAFDDTQKIKLLEISLQLAMWIFDCCPDDVLQKPIRTVNLMQAIRRKRKLKRDEKLKLLEIAEELSCEERLRVGAYLLLGNQDAAELHFAKLEPDVQELFRKWPIYFFWSSNCD